MSELVTHAHTQQQLEQFAVQPSHALLLTGAAGVGKGAIAQTLAAQLLGIELEKLTGQPYVLQVLPEKQSIGIETIRDIQRFLQRKTIGSRNIRRVVIVQDAHTMTTEAQNAFLKSLEEPPRDTVIILTAIKPELLLPTITSRTQNLTVHAPSRQQIERQFGQAENFSRAYHMSAGLPGLLHALIQDDESHPLYQAVNQAKVLLQGSTFTRLSAIESVRTKDQAALLLEALERIVQAGLEQAAGKQQVTALQRWQQWLGALYAAREVLNKNANVKLTLTNLFLSA
jgi:replication-associated recombination protein RarA